MGACQDYGPCLGPKPNTAPGTQEGTIMLQTTQWTTPGIRRPLTRTPAQKEVEESETETLPQEQAKTLKENTDPKGPSTQICSIYPKPCLGFLIQKPYIPHIWVLWTLSKYASIQYRQPPVREPWVCLPLLDLFLLLMVEILHDLIWALFQTYRNSGSIVHVYIYIYIHM